MRLVLAPTLHEHDREVSLLERLMRGTTDGAILMLPEESAEELLTLQRQGFPFVVVDPREPPPDGIACVSAMHAAGSEGGDPASARSRSPPDRRDRRRAWVVCDRGAADRLPRRARRRRACCSTPSWSPIRTGGCRAAPKLPSSCSSLPDPPTAIFGFNDNVAIGVLHAAHQRGLRVPDDLSVVGFDDTELATVVTPQLTSVRQPLAELGRTGVSLLVRLLERQRVDALRMELSTRLVVRETTAPPAAVDRAPRDRRGPRRRRHCDRSGVRAGRRAAQRLRRPAARLGPARACVARRSSARQRVGARRQPDRAVVDGERGELDEHAVLGRRTQAVADGAGRGRPDRCRVVRRQAASRLGRRCLRSRALHLRV